MRVADAEAVAQAPGESDLREMLEVDVSHLVTEDDTPVDSIFSQIQMRLLTEPLQSSWHPGRDFVALSNVGVYASIHQPAVMPNMLLSLDVRLPENLQEKKEPLLPPLDLRQGPGCGG